MDNTCHRCHQSVPDGSCFCPVCGLPQLVYSTEEGGPGQAAERWTEAVRDAGQVEWKPALRFAMMVALPAGLLSCGFSPVGLLGFFWMAAFAAWAVSLYGRRQKPGWITIGAGARIGLVTGLLAGWLAFCSTGIGLYCMRFFLHQGKSVDQIWFMMNENLNQQVQTMNADPQGVAVVRGILASAEGRAGMMLCVLLVLEVGLLVFAAAGGAIGARMVTRSRRPEA
jgi:hypothetical protein